MKKVAYLLLFVLINLNVFAQKKLCRFQNNANFEWIVDSLDKDIKLYYEKNSYTEKNINILKSKLRQHITSTLAFMGTRSYDKPIHYFVLKDRQRMKSLLGYETNGTADAKNNLVTAIFSEKLNSVYSNHELFHLVAMNLWGYPETWINEGMAVYSDSVWQGHDLHQLAKYLIDKDKFIPIGKMTRKLRVYDSMISYPLLGSFVKFIDETYGRETIKHIWAKGKKEIKIKTGKDLEELENEWLTKLKSINYNRIRYLN